MASFDCERQELLNAVASCKNSADGLEHIKNKLQQHNRDIYEEWGKNGFHINHIFRFGTLLHFAVRSKSEDIVESVIKAGADVNLQDSRKVTPLHCAAEKGYLRVVEALLKAGAKIDVQDSREGTALHRAAAMGHSEVVKALINAGANVDFQDVEKRTPLHRAAGNKRARVVEVLLKAGAKVDVQNDERNTALHMAVKWNNLEIVEELIKAGANVNLRCYDVHTPSQGLEWLGIDEESITDSFPLQWAAQSNFARIVDVLLKAGAKINAETKAGETALHAAVRCSHSEVLEILLKAGAKINAKTKAGETALHAAVRYSHSESLEILIKAGADVNIRDQLRMTPLHHAAEEEDCSWMVEALLKAGADPNIQDFFGRTPLHSAAVSECAENIEALLRAGASVYILDNEGEAPLRYQCVVRILIALEIPLNGSEEQKERYHQWYSSDFEREDSQYWDDCLCEVKKMKEVKIDNCMTLYDVLRTKDINKLASHMRNKTRASLLETYNYDNEFPMYAKDLRRQVKIGKERLYYLDVATVILKNMEYISALSNFFHIVLMIAEKLTNEEIEELRDVVIDILDEKKSRLLSTEMDLENMNNAETAGHDTLVKRKRLKRE